MWFNKILIKQNVFCSVYFFPFSSVSIGNKFNVFKIFRCFYGKKLLQDGPSLQDFVQSSEKS